MDAKLMDVDKKVWPCASKPCASCFRLWSESCSQSSLSIWQSTHTALSPSTADPFTLKQTLRLCCFDWYHIRVQHLGHDVALAQRGIGGTPDREQPLSRAQVFPVNPQRFDWGPYWEEMNAGLLQFVLKEDILERRSGLPPPACAARCWMLDARCSMLDACSWGLHALARRCAVRNCRAVQCTATQREAVQNGADRCG
eukprot:2190360-Rhodomonas_salina.4